MLQWFRKQPVNGHHNGNSGDHQVALIRKMVDYLAEQVSSPRRATAIMSQINRFKELPPTYQEKELPALYLKVEQFLVDEDPMQKFTRSQLRDTVKYRFEPLMELENFSVIFEDLEDQELILSQFLLRSLIFRASQMVEDSNETALNAVNDWILAIPHVGDREAPLGLTDPVPHDNPGWIELLVKVGQRLYTFLHQILGDEETASLFEKSYRELAETYRPLETFHIVVHLLPDNLLDESKIGLLNGEQIRNVFLNKVRHLQTVNEELSRTNRELSMKNIELSETQNDLEIAQDTAMESVRLFHAVLDTVEEGIVTADADGNIILVNEQIKRIFGYEEEELVGQSVEMLMPAKYRDQHREGMNRYLETGESHAMGQRLVMEGLRKNRSAFPLELEIAKTTISDRTFFTAAMRDISDDLKNETQLKKTTDNLRLSEQRFRTLVESMNDMIFGLSLDGTFESLNTAFERITGLAREDWIGKPFTQLVDPEDSMLALKLFQQVLQGESTPVRQLRLRLDDTRILVTEFTVAPQLQNGKLVGAIGIAREVVEQSTGDAESFRPLLDRLPEAVGIQVNGKLVFLNRAACALAGVDDENDLIQQPVTTLFDPPRHADIDARHRRILDSGDPTHDVQETLRTTTGTAIPVIVSEAAVRFHGEEAVQFVIRRQPEAPAAPAPETPVSRRPLADLLEHAPDAVLVNDPAGRILTANGAATELLGLSVEAIAATRLPDTFSAEHRESASDKLLQLAQRKLDRFEAVIERPDGTTCPVEIRGKRIGFGGKIALVVFLRDIRHQKTLEEERQRIANELRQARLTAQHSGDDHQELQSRIKELQAEVRDAQMRYRGVKVTLEDTEEKLRKLESAHRDLLNDHADSEALAGEVDTLRDRLAERDADLETLELKRSAAEKRAAAAQERAEQAESERREVRTRLDDLERTHQDSQMELRDVQLRLREATRRLQDHSAASAERDRQLTAASEEAEQLRGDVERFESQVADLQSQLHKSAREIQSAQERLQETRRDLESAREREREQAGRLKAQEAQREGAEGEQARLQSVIAALEGDNGELRQRLDDMKERLGRTEVQFSDAQSALEAEQQRYAELLNRLGETERRLTEARNADTGRDGELQAAQARIGQLSAEVARLKSAAANAPQGDATLKARLAAADQRISELSDQMRTLAVMVPIDPRDGSIRADDDFWQHLAKAARDPETRRMLSGDGEGGE